MNRHEGPWSFIVLVMLCLFLGNMVNACTEQSNVERNLSAMSTKLQDARMADLQAQIDKLKAKAKP